MKSEATLQASFHSFREERLLNHIANSPAFWFTSVLISTIHTRKPLSGETGDGRPVLALLSLCDSALTYSSPPPGFQNSSQMLLPVAPDTSLQHVSHGTCFWLLAVTYPLSLFSTVNSETRKEVTPLCLYLWLDPGLYLPQRKHSGHRSRNETKGTEGNRLQEVSSLLGNKSITASVFTSKHCSTHSEVPCYLGGALS